MSSTAGSIAVPAPSPPAPAPVEAEREWSWARVAAFLYCLLIYFFLYAPVIVMAIFSFNAASVQSLPIHAFSTHWYDRLAHDSEMIDALVFSLKVSVISVTIACIAGTSFAILFTRVRMRGLAILQGLIALPFVMPGMVLGIALLLALRQVGIQPGMLAIVIAHVTFITPIILFIVAQRMRALDPSLEQASMDLGAGPIRTFLNVIFPSIRTALIAAALLGFTVSFDEVIVTFFVSGAEQTLPVHIWTLLRQGFSPVVNAILTIIAVFSVTSITIATIIIQRSRRADA
ncbi:MAG: ABC transporter permease [Actinobacteria bacterium]|nr:ABC transporter permease [Actinomycetota bacterium]